MSSTKALMISTLLAAGLATTAIAAPPAPAGVPSSKGTVSSAASAAPPTSSALSSVKGAAASAAPASASKGSSAGAVKACPAPKPAASSSKAAVMPPQMSQGAAATNHPSPKPPSTGKPKTARDISSTAEELSTSISMYPTTTDTRSTSFSEYIDARTISPSNLNNNRDTTLRRVVRRTPIIAPESIDTIDYTSPVAPVTDASDSLTAGPDHAEPTLDPGANDEASLSHDPGTTLREAYNIGPTATGALAYRRAMASGFPYFRSANGTGPDGVAPPFPVTRDVDHTVPPNPTSDSSPDEASDETVSRFQVVGNSTKRSSSSSWRPNSSINSTSPETADSDFSPEYRNGAYESYDQVNTFADTNGQLQDHPADDSNKRFGLFGLASAIGRGAGRGGKKPPAKPPKEKPTSTSSTSSTTTTSSETSISSTTSATSEKTTSSSISSALASTPRPQSTDLGDVYSSATTLPGPSYADTVASHSTNQPLVQNNTQHSNHHSSNFTHGSIIGPKIPVHVGTKGEFTTNDQASHNLDLAEEMLNGQANTEPDTQLEYTTQSRPTEVSRPQNFDSQASTPNNDYIAQPLRQNLQNGPAQHLPNDQSHNLPRSDTYFESSRPKIARDAAEEDYEDIDEQEYPEDF